MATCRAARGRFSRQAPGRLLTAHPQVASGARPDKSKVIEEGQYVTCDARRACYRRAGKQKTRHWAGFLSNESRKVWAQHTFVVFGCGGRI
ncbi:hypothetical protein [Burkholderia glumae]|uniref:hypothetical protein n=1 Tax=Burkholderia glumae TaxID=337 RepID=UPI0020CFC5EC|nr:hypothetical protein [Burkholderia glumae]